MKVGVYADGRELIHVVDSIDFAIGGTPVTLDQVLEYDAFGQLSWIDETTRAWAYSLKPWADAANAEAREAEAEAARVAVAETKAQAKAEARLKRDQRAKARREAFNEWQRQSQYGSLSSQMVCPHCQTKGSVRTKAITQKKGVSGGKATAAVLTAGVSLLATGLSRKEQSTQAQCGNCRSTWYF